MKLTEHVSNNEMRVYIHNHVMNHRKFLSILVKEIIDRSIEEEVHFDISMVLSKL